MKQFLSILLAVFSVASFAAFPEDPGENGENPDVKVVKAVIDMKSGKPESNYCHDISIDVVVKEGAFNAPVANSIGFYSTFPIQGQMSPSFPVAGLRGSVVSTRNLKYGGKGLVLSFKGRGFCWCGSMSSSMYQRLEFKPYVYYEFVENGRVKKYRKWAEGPNSWLGGGYVNEHFTSRTNFDVSAQLFE